jgi:hypothetical protein
MGSQGDHWGDDVVEVNLLSNLAGLDPTAFDIGLDCGPQRVHHIWSSKLLLQFIEAIFNPN